MAPDMDSALPNSAADDGFGDPSTRARNDFHPETPLIGGREIVQMAQTMIEEFGAAAIGAAQLRAAHARAQDNPYRFCHWKEVERVIGWISAPELSQTRH